MSALDGQLMRAANGTVVETGEAMRVRGLTLEAYAAAIAARELLLDEAKVRATMSSVEGDLARAWQALREHARRHRVPVAEGDLDRTNRIVEWDRLIQNDVPTQRSWREIYPLALLHACGIAADDDAGRAILRYVDERENVLWNPFAELSLRRPDVTAELRAQASRERASRAATFEMTATCPRMTLSEFARIQWSAQKGDMMAVLYRERLDPTAFARICEEWQQALRVDARLRAEYEQLLRRHAELAGQRKTSRLPDVDPVVLPGERLAKVSDFARVSRAARRGEFLQELARAGVDRDTFANLCARFNAKMESEPELRLIFRKLLDDARVDAA